MTGGYDKTIADALQPPGQRLVFPRKIN